MALSTLPVGVRTGHAQAAGPRVVTGAWPLGDFARELEGHYAKPVTFETPLLQWKGHMECIGVGPDGLEMLTFIRHRFVIPASVRVFDAPEISVDLINKVVDVYQQSNPGFPRYRVAQSRMGFHIIPTDARDQDGIMRPTQSVLDAGVEVLTEKRTASGHVQAALDAVTRATGIATRVENLMLRQANWAEHPYTLFEWGASEVSARNALIDLLDGLATMLSWTLASIPDYRHGNRAAVPP